MYSASALGAEEFPDYDVTARSAVSIARRLQDPLAELIKIDPKSIGVGQYQHDMNEKRLHHEIYMSDARNVVPEQSGCRRIILLSLKYRSIHVTMYHN